MRFASTKSRGLAAALLFASCALLACEESFTGSVDPERIPVTIRLDGPPDWNGRVVLGDSITLTATVLDPDNREIVGGWIELGQVGGSGYVVFDVVDERTFRIGGGEIGSAEFAIQFNGGSDVFTGREVIDSVRVVYADVEIQGAGSDTTLTAVGDTAFFSAAASVVGGTPLFDLPGAVWSAVGTGITAEPQSEGRGVRVAANAATAARLVLSHPNCAPDCADTLVVNVVQVPVALEADADSVRLSSLGESTALTATASDSRGTAIPSASLDWRLVNPADSAVIGVTTSGVVTARTNAAGAVPVVVGAGALTDTVHVTSWQAIASIAVQPDSVSFTNLGRTADVTVTVTDPSGGAVVRAYSPSAVPDDAAVASATLVSTSVVRVTSAGDGRTRIAVSAEGVTDSIHVAVQREIAAVTVSPAADTANALGDTIQLTAAATDGGGAPVPLGAGDVAWTSLDAAVSVDTQGRAVAQATGTGRVVATVAGVADTAAIFVQQVPSSVLVEPAADTLEVGQSVTLTGTVADSNGVAISGGSVQWASSATTVATVDGNGAVTAVAAGDAVISATSGSVGGQSAIHVVPPIDRIEVQPLAATLESIDDTTRFTAVVYDTNGGVVATAVPAWAIVNPDVAVLAAVDADAGTADVRAVANGATQLVASYRGRADTVDVTVSQVVAAVGITPAGATIFVADTLRFTATAVDANGHPVGTASIAWSSSDEAVLTVDAGGLMRAIAEGTANVVAASGAHSASASVRVDPRPATAQCAAGSGTSHVGLIGASENWTAASGPHHLTGDVFVSGASVVLTVEPGALVCGDGYKLTAQNGAVVRADAGGANAIVFSASDAATGWQGIVLSGAPADSSLLRNVVVEYADTGIAVRQAHRVRVDSSTIRFAGRLGVDLQSPQARLLNSSIDESGGDGLTVGAGNELIAVTISGSAGRGLYVAGGTPLLDRVRILGSGDVGLDADSVASASIVRVMGGATYGARLGMQAVTQLASNPADIDSLLGNARDTLAISGDSASGANLIVVPALPWRLEADIHLFDSRLNAHAGSSIHFAYEYGHINGDSATIIEMNGTEAERVLLHGAPTSDWGIAIYNGSQNAGDAAVLMSNVVMRGGAVFTQNLNRAVFDSVLVDGGSFTSWSSDTIHAVATAIINGQAPQSWPAVLNLYAGVVTVEHIVIRDSRHGGIRAGQWSPVAGPLIFKITNCEISGSAGDAIRFVDDGNVDDCNLIDNGGLGVEIEGDQNTAVANGNWWGDVGGPSGPGGDGVDPLVTVDSWLTAPTTVTGFPQWMLDEMAN